MAEVDVVEQLNVAKKRLISELVLSQEIVQGREEQLAEAIKGRSDLIRVAQETFSNGLIGEVLGVSERQVQAWARTEPIKRRAKQEVEVVDGRTGEPVTGKRAEIADLDPEEEDDILQRVMAETALD
jgi:hypothetical protein